MSQNTSNYFKVKMLLIPRQTLLVRHGNVILKIEVGSDPLTFINVSTTCGIYKLTLERKNFYDSTEQNDTVPAESTNRNNLHKTVLCSHYESGNVCYRGSKCTFAHGLRELIPKEPRVRRSFPNTSVSRSGVISTDNVQNGHSTPVVPHADLMVTDEEQTIDNTITDDSIPAPVVNLPDVTSSIIDGGKLFFGSLSEPGNSSSWNKTGMRINGLIETRK